MAKQRQESDQTGTKMGVATQALRLTSDDTMALIWLLSLMILCESMQGIRDSSHSYIGL